MSITQEARTQLLAQIVPHTLPNGQELKGTKLPNGMIKTAQGLLIQPSMVHQDGIQFATLTPREREIQQLPPEEEPEQAQAPEEPVSKPTKRKSKKQETKEIVVREFPEVHDVPRLYVDGIGTIPTSQYKICVVGDGMILLGMTDEAFVPSIASKGQDGNPTPIVRTSPANEKRYVFMGHRVNIDKLNCILLIQLP